MMDICIDSCGFLAQAFESSRTAPVRLRRYRKGAPDPNEFEPERVRREAANLPFEEAHALWLIDVCGYSYADAAEQSCADVETIRHRVETGRHRLRMQLV